MAHMNAGVDDPLLGTVFSLGLMLFFGLLLLNQKLKAASPVVAVIALVFAAWLGLGFFGEWPQARFEITTLAAAGAIAGAGYVIAANASTLKLAWTMLNWTLLLFTVYSLYQHMNTGFATGDRLSAGFGSPNTAATLFGLAILLAISKILLRLQDPKMGRMMRGDRFAYLAQMEYASIALLLLAGVSLILTVSRAGILVSLLCFIALSGFELRRVSRRGRASFVRSPYFRIPAAFVAFCVIALAMTGEINPQTSEALFENMEGRFYLFDHYLTLWSERPIFGYGLGSFNALNDSTTTLDNASSLVPMGAAHNVVVQWLIQQGLAGLFVMGTVILGIHTQIVKALIQPSSLPRHFLRLSIAATILVFAHGMVDYALEIPSVMWTYAYILGLAAGFATTTSRRISKPDE